MNNSRLLSIIDNFNQARIAVVGDVMLDKYDYGEITRLNPEASAPLVRIRHTTYMPGGAGNTSVNISSLKGNARVYGYVGNDYYAHVLVEELAKRGVESELYPELSETIVKERTVVDGNQILRKDREENNLLPSRVINDKLIKSIAEYNPHVIAISDYKKGVISGELVSMLKNYAEENHKKIIVDTKPENLHLFKNVYAIKPNAKEAREMTGLQDIEAAGLKIHKEMGCNVIITRGKDGASLFEYGKHIYIPTEIREKYDVTGAGDTFMSILALCSALKADLEDGAILANDGAGVVVGKIGTSCISQNELKHAIRKEQSKIKTIEEIIEEREQCRRRGEIYGLTNGGFEILRPHHVAYLENAKSLCDHLVVGINSDKSIELIKGPGRPVNSEEERARVLAGLSSVNSVFVFYEKDFCNSIELLKPDVYFKGGDYTIETIVQSERRAVERNKGKVIILPKENSLSTTETINKINRLAPFKNIGF